MFTSLYIHDVQARVNVKRILYRLRKQQNQNNGKEQARYNQHVIIMNGNRKQSAQQKAFTIHIPTFRCFFLFSQEGKLKNLPIHPDPEVATVALTDGGWYCLNQRKLGPKYLNRMKCTKYVTACELPCSRGRSL